MSIFGQKDASVQHKLSLSAYVDTYFAGYDNDLNQQEFQPFITVGARDNTFGVNVAQVGLNYMHEKIRGNFILHYGDIPQATWSDEFNAIQEANVGVKIIDGLWLDAGFFATHIGTESFLPKNNLLSHTMYLTFNEPFYQAGAKLSYDTLENWYIELWALNGYNNFVDNNDAKSLGTLINYTISKNTSITYTNLYGRESEDSSPIDQDRFYQNIYINHHWNEKIYLIAGFDYGFQTNSDLQETNETASMYGGMITARYQFNPTFSVTGRAEIFNDKNGFISGTVIDANGNEAGIELTGFTLGTEYRPLENSYLRAEVRNTRASDDLEIFMKNDELTNNRFEVLFTMGIAFEQLFGF
ncbi:porin [Gangjinia marincola]|uniref:Porin n=1 Tax=Gangjinia marincola TaxID=578463 RepID=A0ABN1MJH2_9FLAO